MKVKGIGFWGFRVWGLGLRGFAGLGFGGGLGFRVAEIKGTFIRGTCNKGCASGVLGLQISPNCSR